MLKKTIETFNSNTGYINPNRDNFKKHGKNWGNRMKTWYELEKRLIFACDTKEEMQEWIRGINSASIKNNLHKVNEIM